MKVTILGDNHGRWDDLYRCLRNNPDSEAFIQVGDLGIIQGLKSIPPKQGFDRPVYFIDGNHENHWWLKTKVEENSLEIVPNLFYIPRGTQKIFGKTPINFLGGAESIDKNSRILGRDWFPEEIPNRQEVEKFLSLPESDIWITHTAPEFVISKFAHYKASDPTSHYFNQVFTSKRPKIWYFGHFHLHYNEVIRGTRFICVPCTHDHYYFSAQGSLEDIRGFDGFTLIL
jgi:hypothetical protein